MKKKIDNFSKFAPVDYHVLRNIVNEAREAGFDPEVIKRRVLEGGSFVRSFRISNALQCAMDVYLKECNDQGVRYRHFTRFNEIHQLIYDTYGNPSLEEWERVAEEMRECGGGDWLLEGELVWPQAPSNEGWELLPGNELPLYSLLHDMPLFREMKAQFVSCGDNGDVALMVVRPLVVTKRVSFKQAVSDRFIKALLSMVLYEEGANVKSMRSAIHTAIDDLAPQPKRGLKAE